MKLWRKIKYLPIPFWLAEIRRFFRHIPHGIRNLIDWFPIIWRDYDWDWEFLNDMLIFKLTRMTATFRSDKAFGVDKYDRADEMWEVVEHLKFLRDNPDCPDNTDGSPLTLEDYQRHDQMLKDHQTRAFYLIGVNLRGWWD